MVIDAKQNHQQTGWLETPEGDIVVPDGDVGIMNDSRPNSIKARENLMDLLDMHAEQVHTPAAIVTRSEASLEPIHTQAGEVPQVTADIHVIIDADGHPDMAATRAWRAQAHERRNQEILRKETRKIASKTAKQANTNESLAVANHRRGPQL